jgi:alpha-galactosidase
MNKDKLKICYIGGGSRNRAWVFMQDLAFEKEICGEIELYDLIFKDAHTNEIIGNRLMEKYNNGRWKFHANHSLDNALEGSDIVIISILPGDIEKMAADVHAPEKHGIYQSVGDTVGAGGIMRALRAIPQFIYFAQEIKKYAPAAWIINYTNPMSICTRTLYKEFPKIKAFGCCHDVFYTQKLLATVLEEAGYAPPNTIKREEIIVNVLGINHFTWIDKAYWKDIDIFPIYEAFVKKYSLTGFKKTNTSGSSLSADELERQKYFGSTDRVKMDLFRRFGLIAAADDRRLAEFCPHSWYLSSPETAERWGFALTPVSWRIKDRDKLIQKAKAYSDGIEEMIPAESGEEGIKIIKALMGLGDITTNVNFPNNGQMPDLPKGVVVETNAVFKRDNIEPVSCFELPVDLRLLITKHILTQEEIIEAAYGDDLEKAFRVFSHDHEIKKLPPGSAYSLFNEMLQLN